MSLVATGGGEFGWSTYRLIEGGKTRVLAVGDSAARLVSMPGPTRSSAG